MTVPGVHVRRQADSVEVLFDAGVFSYDDNLTTGGAIMLDRSAPGCAAKPRRSPSSGTPSRSSVARSPAAQWSRWPAPWSPLANSRTRAAVR
ncbi:hypothetical protein [Fodinicola feengrottensis]|uniref:hypothetical protein n=1 Tax=Fodinicola feengrottensis TaxID=435914 RepID=UPI002441BCB4|nr:hypothetical protein [Fodinicola feengrottensis]